MNENVMTNSTDNEVTNEGSPSIFRQAVLTILTGGLTVGILDGLFALVYYGLILGADPFRIFQSVASGILGKASYEGGTSSFVLGVFLHFIVASCITTVYFLVSRIVPLLNRYAVPCGLIYGLLAYLGMNYVVVPLSNAGQGKFNLVNFIVAFIGHAVLVGLPIALITKKFSSSAKS